MERQAILQYLENQEFQPDRDWYLHATKRDIKTIQTILNEGILSSYLRRQKGNHYNGKYYVSLYKNNEEAKDLRRWLITYPKFVIHDIEPYYADRQKLKSRRNFINTRIPLRTSEWDGEFQQYLKIDPSKFVALEYSFAYILSKAEDRYVSDHIEFLKQMIFCMEEANRDLPVYDLSSNHEINKQKLLSLEL